MTNQANEELRPMVERLIIENRNSLNDPTTNEPYDVKGIADDFIELLQSHTNKAISDVLDNLIKQEWKFSKGVDSYAVPTRYIKAERNKLKEGYYDY